MLLGRGQLHILTPSFPSWTETGNYTCEFCGKQYKYYTPYQEHVALHAPISEYLLPVGMGGWGTRDRVGQGGPAVGQASGIWPGNGESKVNSVLGQSLGIMSDPGPPVYSGRHS